LLLKAKAAKAKGAKTKGQQKKNPNFVYVAAFEKRFPNWKT